MRRVPLPSGKDSRRSGGRKRRENRRRAAAHKPWQLLARRAAGDRIHGFAEMMRPPAFPRARSPFPLLPHSAGGMHRRPRAWCSTARTGRASAGRRAGRVRPEPAAQTLSCGQWGAEAAPYRKEMKCCVRRAERRRCGSCGREVHERRRWHRRRVTGRDFAKLRWVWA